jgi:NAD(P)-dependent dehydrogenase (short-subunit alcohol dehydrogenase family)
MNLKSKRVVVLGGTSGIGGAVAAGALAEGAQVVVVSSQQSRVDQALARLGDGVSGQTADLKDEASVEELIRRIGLFDHMVYTAGDSVWQSDLSETGLTDAKNFFEVRFWGAFLAVKHASKSIRAGGSIVLTSSTLPHRPVAGFTIGASVAAAVDALARSLAVELAPVRVNVVAPGVVRTPLWDRFPQDQRESFFNAHGAGLPVGKVGEPEELAEAYLFLMRSTFTTGQVLVADGGALLV